MLPDPLHPAIVHIPIALAVLIPLLSACAALAIHYDALPRRVWSGVVLLCFVLVMGSWFAMETGESDEERVESVVAERYIEAHEEAAEVFMTVGVIVAVVALVGLLAGATGQFARMAVVVLSLGLLVSGARLGHLGGALVYEHGAAAAHSARSSGRLGALDTGRDFADEDRHERDHDDDD